MLKPILLGLTMGVLAAFSGYGVATTQSDRPDCPGRVVCPLTGQEICADRCPADAGQRPDCPGQVTCPLDGQPVCRDRCPATAAQTDQPVAARSCCSVTS